MILPINESDPAGFAPKTQKPVCTISLKSIKEFGLYFGHTLKNEILFRYS